MALAQEFKVSAADILRDPLKTFILGVLVMVLMIFGFYLWGERTKVKAYKVIDLHRGITRLSTAAIDWSVRYNKTYDTVSLDALKASLNLPRDFLETPYGGRYSIAGKGRSFTISVTAVPAVVCDSMVRSLSGHTITAPSCSDGTLIAVFAPDTK